jgi:hypothetical protein
MFNYVRSPTATQILDSPIDSASETYPSTSGDDICGDKLVSVALPAEGFLSFDSNSRTLGL